MNRLRIGIVEDELPIAKQIEQALTKKGYGVAAIATNYKSALKMIETEKPDLVIIDVNLGEIKDGMDIASVIKEKYFIPFIFTTANNVEKKVQRSKPLQPNGFLIKPISENELYAAIEIGVSNFYLNQKTSANSILVKEGYDLVKVYLRNVMFVSKDQNYVTLHLGKKNIIVRSTLSEIEKALNHSMFTRVNKGHIININYVTKIEKDKVFINNQSFSLSQQQHKTLIALMK